MLIYTQTNKFCKIEQKFTQCYFIKKINYKTHITKDSLGVYKKNADQMNKVRLKV